MSGIIAILHKDKSTINKEWFVNLVKYMDFCGPDAQDYWYEGNVALGNSLLKITFESENEKQPFTVDNKVWITADARVDARNELIGKLRSCEREVSKATPDVELILHSYFVWGEKCLDHLIGNFSFIIWDSNTQKLFCAHDHFGIVPLYYADFDNVLIVSSVIDAIRKHPIVSAKLNQQMVGDFLLFGMNMDLTTTIFADIKRLPPHHSLIWNGQLKTFSYWTPEESEKKSFSNIRKHSEQFRNVFRSVMEDCLRIQSAGTHLTGGLDSTSIAAMALDIWRKRGNPFDFRSYTIVYNEVVQEKEGYYARLVAEHLNIPNQHFAAEDYNQQTPIACSRDTYPEPGMIKSISANIDILFAIAKHSRVCFTGFGGDPLFTPDNNQLTSFRQKEISVRWNKIKTYVSRPQLYIYPAIYNLLKKKKPSAPNGEFLNFFSDSFLKNFEPQERFHEMLQLNRSLRGKMGMFKAPLWSWIFHNSDPGAYKIPLKIYFPFFDLRLWEYMDTVPPIPHLLQKFLLRESMKPYFPKPIYHRRKTPLPGGPLQEWRARRGVPVWIFDLLKSPEISVFVDYNKIEPFLSPSHLPRIRSCANFAYWLKYGYK